MARPKGTTKFNYSKQQADRIERLAMIGCTDEHISLVEKMSEATLKKLYAEELKYGRGKGIADIANTAHQMALSGKVPAMTMFWLKAKGRWKEVHQIEHTGVDGKPIETKSDMVFETQWREKPKNESNS